MRTSLSLRDIFVRLVRGNTLALKRQTFVEAARSTADRAIPFGVGGFFRKFRDFLRYHYPIIHFTLCKFLRNHKPSLATAFGNTATIQKRQPSSGGGRVPDWGGGSCAMSKEGTDVAPMGRGRRQRPLARHAAISRSKGPAKAEKRSPASAPKAAGRRLAQMSTACSPCSP